MGSNKFNDDSITSLSDPIELIYYDQLANQTDPIFLTVRKEERLGVSSNGECRKLSQETFKYLFYVINLCVP